MGPYDAITGAKKPQKKQKKRVQYGDKFRDMEMSPSMRYAQLLARKRGVMMPAEGVPRRDGMQGLMDMYQESNRG